MAPAEKNPDLVAFGANVRARRNELKLTQPQLATAIGVTRQAIYNWEAGNTGASDEMMRALCDALKTTPETLSPSWEPNSTGWGGRRGASLPAPQRLDLVEAELRAMRSALEAHGIKVETPGEIPEAPEIDELVAQHEQETRESAADARGRPRKVQGS